MLHGANCIIVSRTHAKLEAAAMELEERTGGRCLPVSHDKLKYRNH